MPAGAPTFRYLQLLTEFGLALSYADRAAFEAADWALTFKSAADGVALASQPTWDIAVDGTDGVHRVVIDDEPADPWYGAISVPSGAHTPQLLIAGQGEAYDNDALAGLLLAAIGDGGSAVIGSSAATIGRLDDWVEGDWLYRSGLVIPQWALDGIGAADLNDCTILCGLKEPFPTKQSADAVLATLTVTIVSAVTREVKIDNAWVVAAALGSGLERKAFKVDISVKKAAKQITSNRYDLDVVWQADVT